MDTVLARLARIGARPGLPMDEVQRQGTLIIASVLISALSTIWTVTYFAFGYPLSAAIPLFYQVVTIVGLVVLSRTHDFAVFRRSQLVVFLVLPALLQASLGGFIASSGMILWSVVVPFAAITLIGPRRSVGWLVAYLADVVLLALLDPQLSEHRANLPSPIVTSFFVLNVIGMTVSGYTMLGYFVDQRERARIALEAERERSERLLLNVLPGPIAERLKAADVVIADSFDDVSVVFADLVGFTSASVAMSPEQLVEVLNRIFTGFDDIAGRHRLEKIKTIGDAYMLAGGLPERRADHLDDAVAAALAMRRWIDELASTTTEHWLAVRIGVDAGPAVAGVIGRRKFIYDLWGDTVNTASRMESHGVPGRIQVTERVAARLGPAFSLEERGVVDVKGKGPMRTFFVDAAADPAPREVSVGLAPS